MSHKRNDIPVTISFSENSKGWTSFKSFLKENGVSLNNRYYTFKNGHLWEHNENETRGSFYGGVVQPSGLWSNTDSSFSHVRVLFNDAPGSVKSFGTLNYEGSQAKNTPDITNDAEYYNNFLKLGWYVEEIETNLQNGVSLEFKNKEGKWFSKIKGEATEWLADGKAGNIDTKEFSVQGIGNNSEVTCPDCPQTLWKCVPGTAAIPGIPAVLPTSGTPAIPAIPAVIAVPGVNSCSNLTQVTAPSIASVSNAISWLSAPSQANVDFEHKTICVPNTSTSFNNFQITNLCSCNSQKVTSGFSVGTFRWSYTNGSLLVGPQQMGSWNAFINAIIATNDPIFTSVTTTMDYNALTSQMTSNFYNSSIIPNQSSYGRENLPGQYDMYTPNISWGVCQCDSAVVAAPAIPAVPATPATLGSPAIPAIPGIPCECISVTDGSGTYLTEPNCLNQCCNSTLPTPPVESWNCVNGVCIDPGNGLGQYSSLINCQTHCVQPIIPSTWDCVTGSVVDNSSCSTKTYVTLPIPSTYNDFGIHVANPINGLSNINSDDLATCLTPAPGPLGWTHPTHATQFNWATSQAQYNPNACICGSSSNGFTIFGAKWYIREYRFTTMFPNEDYSYFGQDFSTSAASYTTWNNFVSSLISQQPTISLISGTSNYNDVITMLDSWYTSKSSGDNQYDYGYHLDLAEPSFCDCSAGQFSSTLSSCVEIFDGSGQFNSLVDCQNNCTTTPILSSSGCTDPLAVNYDPNATVDDGSCVYLCDQTWKPTIQGIVHDSGICPSNNYDGEMFASGIIPDWHSGDTWQWNVVMTPTSMASWPLGGSGQFSTANVNIHFQGPPPPLGNNWWEWVSWGNYTLVITHYRNGGDNSPTGECTYTIDFAIECQTI